MAGEERLNNVKKDAQAYMEFKYSVATLRIGEPTPLSRHEARQRLYDPERDFFDFFNGDNFNHPPDHIWLVEVEADYGAGVHREHLYYVCWEKGNMREAAGRRNEEDNIQLIHEDVLPPPQELYA